MKTMRTLVLIIGIITASLMLFIHPLSTQSQDYKSMSMNGTKLDMSFDPETGLIAGRNPKTDEIYYFDKNGEIIDIKNLKNHVNYSDYEVKRSSRKSFLNLVLGAAVVAVVSQNGERIIISDNTGDNYSINISR